MIPHTPGQFVLAVISGVIAKFLYAWMKRKAIEWWNSTHTNEKP